MDSDRLMIKSQKELSDKRVAMLLEEKNDTEKHHQAQVTKLRHELEEALLACDGLKDSVNALYLNIKVSEDENQKLLALERDRCHEAVNELRNTKVRCYHSSILQ